MLENNNRLTCVATARRLKEIVQEGDGETQRREKGKEEMRRVNQPRNSSTPRTYNRIRDFSAAGLFHLNLRQSTMFLLQYTGLNALPFDPASHNDSLQFNNTNGPLVTKCPSLENTAENGKKRKRTSLPPAVLRTTHPNNFTLDTALPCILSNTPVKCEVDWMNGCRENPRRDLHTASPQCIGYHKTFKRHFDRIQIPFDPGLRSAPGPQPFFSSAGATDGFIEG
ncbi:hypothetical protein PAMP_023168 [Pampus punctatissimus]